MTVLVTRWYGAKPREIRVTEDDANVVSTVAPYDLLCDACPRLIREGASYAYAQYGHNSSQAQIVRGRTYSARKLYHWECTPQNIEEVLPLFFPSQEWKMT